MIIKGRFPVPRLVVCDQHGSQVLILYFYFLALYVCSMFCQVNTLARCTRFLLAKLNHINAGKVFVG
jgi:hypothetical protein